MHSGVNTRPERTFGWPKGGVVASLLLLWFGCFMAGPIENAWAATYTYVDDKGTVVFTDNKDNIPARYRARVIAGVQGLAVQPDHHSFPGPGEQLGPGGAMDSAIHAAAAIDLEALADTTVERFADSVTAKVTGKITDTASQSPITIPGLSPYQSRVLSLAFVGAVLIAGTMLLSGNPALRFLMRWLLVLLAIGTTASMYFSEGGLAQKATGTAKELERTQQQKSQQIQQMEPTEKGP